MSVDLMEIQQEMGKLRPGTRDWVIQQMWDATELGKSEEEREVVVETIIMRIMHELYTHPDDPNGK